MSPLLSTTAYAVLGMLALRPLSPYELAQQMQRSLDYCWPTSERSLYDQPQRLVAAGLAVLLDDDASDKKRYGITQAGRDALRGWLATDTAMPRFQNEPLLRVLLADQGSVEDLRRVLSDLRAHLDDRRRLGLEQMSAYLRGEGLFQERAHIVTIVADLVGRLLDALDDWAAEVDELASTWDSTDDLGLTPEIRAMLERLVATEATRVR